MKTPRLTLAVSLLTLAASLGCEEPKLTTTPVAAPPAETPKDAPPQLGGGPPTELPEDEIPITDVPRKFTSHDPIKGRRSRTRGGALGTTVAALPYAEHQMIIYNIDHALQLYQAEHGEYPKSQAEFDAKIIKFNNINLPKLPEYAEYIYVPEQADVGLQIRRKQTESKEATDAAPADAAQPPTEEAAADNAAEPDANGAPEGATAEEQPEPVYDIRSRAAAVGEAAANRSAEEQP
jgi:hypothetical protein